MKNKIIIILLLSINIIYSQQETISEALKYYPLHIGDYWEYKVTKRGQGPNDNDEWIGHREVVGDTLFNDKNYYHIEENRVGTLNRDFIYKSYIRIDSSMGNIYKYDYSGQDLLIDSLFIQIGDTLKQRCSKLSEFYFKDIFGNNIETRLYTEACMTGELASYDIEISKNFGMTYKLYGHSYVTPIIYEYVLVYAKIDEIEYGIKTDVKEKKIISENYFLEQNYPNPFNPITKIYYYLPTRSYITLSVYDVLGTKLSTLVQEIKEKGNHEIQFDGSRLSSGVYYYILDYGESQISKKMVLIK